MRPEILTQTGPGTSNPVPVDYIQVPFNVGLFLDVTGTVSSSIEITPDNIFDAAVTPVWFPCGIAALTTATSDSSGALTIPCRAVRINQATGTGSSRLIVIQGIGG